ncbi:uncharacterized protein LOC135685711 isoform X2 [Rhopilema esculentum]|uniref:uncharacterized protein LOC135685711 isoform X2 n=1 Tax=Rhopilema esculentum TaxID=499914 RepID=UPI0031D76836
MTIFFKFKESVRSIFKGLIMNLHWLIYGLIHISVFGNTLAYIVKWNKDASLDSKEGELKIQHDLVAVGNNGMNSSVFRKHFEKFAKYSLDEKCRLGLDLSVAFQVYTPYIDIRDHSKYLILSGILPAIMSDILKFCCNKSTVTFGEWYKSIPQAEERYEEDKHLDFTFPLYGLDGPNTNLYKENPFIPLVEAPRMVLLVPEQLFETKNTRTHVLLKTILNSWPMLVFIAVSASLSGLIIWFLDRNKNPGEFPPSFFVGAWEGFWWAFVTMTTVGYGDRSPKSIMARIFCILWILCGIILISLFTGLVTAALSVSATPVFNLPGARIGAVSGSKEFQVGVGLNADMQSYENHHSLFDDLENNKLDGAIIDNFILSAIRHKFQETKLRIEREIPYSITYGTAIRSNSPNVEKCFRKYVHHYPRKMFEVISNVLKPVKNPTDETRVEVLAAEKLFYEENKFKLVVYVQTGCLGIFVVGGIIWEFFVRNSPTGKYGIFHATARKAREENDENPIIQSRKYQEVTNMPELENLIDEYETFHGKWMAKVQQLRADWFLLKSRNGNSNKSIEVVEESV